jgi:hypothetical protein
MLRLLNQQHHLREQFDIADMGLRHGERLHIVGLDADLAKFTGQGNGSPPRIGVSRWCRDDYVPAGPCPSPSSHAHARLHSRYRRNRWASPRSPQAFMVTCPVLGAAHIQ